MPRKREPYVRTTISLSTVIMDMMQHQMRAEGFCGNASAYIADLIRRKQEKLKGPAPDAEPHKL